MYIYINLYHIYIHIMFIYIYIEQYIYIYYIYTYTHYSCIEIYVYIYICIENICTIYCTISLYLLISDYILLYTVSYNLLQHMKPFAASLVGSYDLDLCLLVLNDYPADRQCL